MKVLILANFGMGLYKFRKELIEELLKQNYEIYLSLPSDEEYVPELIKMGCHFIETSVDRRGTNPITDFKLFLQYKKIIKTVKPDVVLTYTIKPNIYGGLACRISNTPYLPNITGLGTAVENDGLLQKLTLFLYKISLKNASCVFFQNKENQQFLIEKNVVKGNTKVLPGSGVNVEYYSVLEYPNSENIEFIFISRIMKEKGIDQYIEAAKYIKKKYPNTKFHIVGFSEENYEEKLKNLEKDNIVIYHGFQKDIRKYLKHTHCTIHPTYYPEGLSNVLLESAASGRPIITTNRSGCREIVEEGVNGYLVNPKDSKDLIKKIEKFLSIDNNEKIKMGLAGRKKVEYEFDRAIVVNEYIQQIKQIGD